MSPSGDSPFSSARPKRPAVVFGAIFVCIWAVVVLGFDAVVIHDSLRASASARFTPAAATIRSSEVVSQRGGGKHRSRTYKARVRYTYSVAGAVHEGSRIRYGEFSSSSSSRARADASRYAVGSAVTAYFNPSAPGEAVLEPGFSDSARFIFVLLLPFNLLFAAIAIYGRLSLRGGVAGPPRVFEEAVTRVRLAVLPPSLIGLAGAIGASVVAIVVCGSALGFEVTPNRLVIIYSGVLGGGVIAALWMARRIAAGRYDLTIDPTGRIITIPPARLPRGMEPEVRFDDIRDVDVAASTTTTVNRRPVKDVLLVIDRGAGEERIRLRSWSKAAVAHEFARWLKGRVAAR
ncbi:MAG: DUF3592 domain-containing protein [Phycisphaerales bacterium]|nr:DUF3592 domain-containing protein [Phycisphaerales bacterium]